MWAVRVTLSESLDEEPPENYYSVDAFACGNWTRFINHSCQPNMRVIPVVSDSMPKGNISHLAFVATQNIDAYSELTFDYRPARQREWERKTLKEQRRMRTRRAKKSETRCMCRAPNCRSFL
ncbi:hypothetical protein B0H12DRAFT_1134607 [Mycena haematopus]|nr:hypothetical protein B0H12DRAFT_1134607 [Mycena haematopus]